MHVLARPIEHLRSSNPSLSLHFRSHDAIEIGIAKICLLQIDSGKVDLVTTSIRQVRLHQIGFTQ